jgi:hypothetical protein
VTGVGAALLPNGFGLADSASMLEKFHYAPAPAADYAEHAQAWAAAKGPSRLR